jgi:CHAD domain-containing protein
MAFRLRLLKSVDQELRRLSARELASALDALRKSRPAEEDVHEARKSIKKVRAIQQLIEADDGSGFGRSAKRLRSVNRVLSRLRDADATIAALTKLKQADRRLFDAETFAQVCRRLRVLKGAAASGGERKPWPRLRKKLRRLRRDVRHWDPDHRRFGALKAGVRQSLEEGREARARALDRGEPGDFHEWRKALKALWYQLRLLEKCGPAVRRDVRALGRAEERLGDDHDLVMLGSLLATNNDMRGLVDPDRLRRASNRLHQRWRRAAVAATRRLYARSSRAYLRGLERAWTRARHDAASS